MMNVKLSALILLLAVSAGIAATNEVASGDALRRSSAYERAMDLKRKGVIFEAVHELEIYSRSYPDDEKAHVQLAVMLLKVGRERRAAEEAARALRINPSNAEAQRLLTGIRIKLGRGLDRSDPDAVLDYARLCARPETYDRAVVFYRMYFNLRNDNKVRAEFGQMLYWAGRYVEAERQLRIYLDHSPNDLEARRLLGRVYDALGRFDDAVKQYRKCQEGDSGDINIQIDIARSLLWGGHFQEAEDLLTQIRRRSGKDGVPLMLLASIARTEGRLVDEYDLYKEVLKTDPGNREALERVAELEKGTLLEETRCINKLLSNPDDVETRRKLIDIYLSENRFGEAVPHLEVLSRRFPRDLGIAEELRLARDSEGQRVLAELHKLREAKAKSDAEEIASCQSWLSGNPNDYRSRLRLADLLAESGEYEKSMKQLEILDSMTPGSARIMERMSRVQSLVNSETENGQD